MTDYLGGLFVAGGKLKEAGTTHWVSPNTGATNESGFRALPGGLLEYDFHDIGYFAIWWSSTEYDADWAWWGIVLNTWNTDISGRFRNPKWTGFSVRCLKD